MLGRPIPIWLILAFLVYGGLGTAANLIANGGSYTAFSIGLGVASIGAMAWLILEIWRHGEKQVLAAWLVFGLLAAQQLFGLILFEPTPSDEPSTRSQWIAAGLFTMVLIAIYAAIPLYLARIRRRT